MHELVEAQVPFPSGVVQEIGVGAGSITPAAKDIKAKEMVKKCMLDML